MTATAFDWTPDPFLTDFERRADGTMLMRPRAQLGAYLPRLTDALQDWANAAPERTFVAQRDASGTWVRVSYRDMLHRVQRVAAGLAGYDLSVERPIAILSGNGIEHLTLALAAMWIGVPYCPVSPSYSQVAGDLNKLRYVMSLLTPGLVAAFETRSFETALSTVVPPGIPVVGDAAYSARNVIGLEALECAPAARDGHAHDAVGPDTIAKFLLTSGSTGNPKAVITTMRMLCSNALMLRQALPFLANEPPVLVDWLPWNHTFGGSHNIGLVLFNGGTLYIDDGRPTSAGMGRTLRNLREIAPTVYFNVPKGFEALAQHLQGDHALRANFYSRLRAYFFAGASLAQHTRDTLDELSRAERGHQVPMLSGLGATETGPSVTFTTPATQRTDTIGLPAAGNTVKLVPVAGKLELRVRGPNVTPGYWRQPELTAAAFDEEGYYRLGDAVSLLDPADPTRGMRFDGRIAEDFKLASGTWVSVGPLRVELLGALAPLLQDVVIGGLNRDYLAAVLIPDVAACARVLGLPQAPLHAELARHPELLALLRERLQGHAARHPASSMRIRRALLIPTAPSLDHGEITDKGSFNQRAVLENRPECVAMLYAPTADAAVIDLGDGDAGFVSRGAGDPTR
jgi:feruloyl-CoA synthase